MKTDLWRAQTVKTDLWRAQTVKRKEVDLAAVVHGLVKSEENSSRTESKDSLTLWKP